MKISRNAPCPCGSGRKYEDCCLRVDREHERSTRRPSQGAFRASGDTLVAARAEELWEADVLPLPWTLDDDPDARPSLLAVMAGPHVVRSEVLRRPSGEGSEAAAVLFGAVEEAAELVGRWPPELVVRQPEVALHLDPGLRERGCFVRAEPYLSELDRMAVAMAYAGDTTTEHVSRLVVSRPDTWSAWGLDSTLVGRIFAAARDFWRAAPWEAFLPFEVVQAELPDGSAWYVAILGGAADPPRGVAMYADLDDCRISASSDSLYEVVDQVEGRFYTVLFEDAPRLPRAMRREAARRAWPVAAPAAYPRLMAVNTPAGGLSREDAAMLVAVMGGVASLVSKKRDEILDDRWRAWNDPASGVRFALVEPPDDGLDDDEDGWFPDESDWLDDDIQGPHGDASGGTVLSAPSLLEEMLDETGREELTELMDRTPPPHPEEVQDVLRRASDRYNERPQAERGASSPPSRTWASPNVRRYSGPRAPSRRTAIARRRCMAASSD